VNISERVSNVRGRIDTAARRAGRDPADVTLVAVSKTFPVASILEAHAAGVVDFGENRAQEFKEKAAVVGRRQGLMWHFIGHLQTNKVRHVTGAAALIHSVDRIGLANAISRRAQVLGIRQDVLIEVNLAGEANKTGVDPARAAALAEEVAGLPGVRVRGVMTIPPYPREPEDSRPFFQELIDLRAQVSSRVPGAVHASMGMTRDFQVAIEEGATIVRVGEAIFGRRGTIGE